MTESRLYGATIAFECSKMNAKILELSKMALFQVDTVIKIKPKRTGTNALPFWLSMIKMSV